MAEQTQSPLHFLVREVAEVHNARFFYAAIALALTLPDVCSKLMYEPSDEAYWKGGQRRYEAWCASYLTTRLTLFTPGDLWALRGGVIHQGQTFGHPKASFARVVFILPDGRGNQISIETGQDADKKLVSSIDTRTFCQAFIDAVEDFIAKTKDDPIVQKNVAGVVRFRPNGYEGHIMGLPVIT